ncbi:hypothetical protein PROFUN_01703 [Planoprotostelium fungivorum]|uniref:TLC domain-containing protein n=1 Tax=Planoprotostelium fungivorum TaxID=1890364 RepID=A0A2P6MWB2_9EUKA|nr:hypothetical protein PROFUN_01703 [Planoprotostelium fungivorum]
MCTFVDSHGVIVNWSPGIWEISLVHIILKDKKITDPWDFSGGRLEVATVYQPHTEVSTMAPPVLSSLDQATLTSLSEMLSERILPQTPSWFTINVYVLIMATYFLVRLLHDVILPNHVVGKMRWWKEFTHEHRRTMVIYVLQVVYTTIALGLQFAAIPVFWLEYRPHRLNFLQYACNIVAVLYCTELLYRTKMRIPMITHHISTLFAISIGFSMLFTLEDPSFISTGAAWLLQATTEQTTFVALFMYRMKIHMRWVQRLLYISALQSLLFKMFSTALTTYYWAQYQRFPESSTKPATVWAWNFMFWTATLCLMVTQFWGSWILYVLGRSVKVRYNAGQQPSSEDPMELEVQVDVASSSHATVELPEKSLSSYRPADKEKNASTVSSFHELPSTQFHVKRSRRDLLKTLSHSILYPTYESSSEEDEGEEINEEGKPEEGM